MDNRKKITAAISAVISYIQDEEAALSLHAAQATPTAAGAPVSASTPASPPTFWGVSGRQSQMQLRNLMQLRAFNRL